MGQVRNHRGKKSADQGSRGGTCEVTVRNTRTLIEEIELKLNINFVPSLKNRADTITKV